MAHGKRAAAISDILAPSPPLRSGSGVSTQSEEDQRRLVGEASEQTPCALINGDNDHLTPPVPAHQLYMTCEPNPEDMEDTCSEYDNVGSDVEQDCDEVLHLNREAVGGVRFYKPVCPEDAKHTVGDNVKEASHAVDRLAPRSRPSTETFKGLQSGVKPHKGSRSFRPYCAPSARDEAQRGVEKGHENRFLFSDGDEIEEVLDGARFIEDLEETESSALTKTRLCQDSEKDRIRKRGDDPRVTRKKNLPGGCKKRELSHVDSKERHGKGRGRRGTGEDTERVVSAVKGATTCSADQRPKTSSKDSRKGSVRSKARSSKQHPPPSPRRGHSPANTQKAQQHGEMPPVPEPTPSSAASPDSEPGVARPAQSHQERQEEPPEDAQKEPEKVQQVTSRAERHCDLGLVSPRVNNMCVLCTTGRKVQRGASSRAESGAPSRRGGRCTQGSLLFSCRCACTACRSALNYLNMLLFKETQQAAAFPSFEDGNYPTRFSSHRLCCY